jgi:malate dehydrogenase
MVHKISIIGAGNVGASLGQRLIEKDIADIVLLDIEEGLSKGKALDIYQSSPITHFSSKISGTSDYQDTAKSDVIIITSGIGRKPGMTRDELLEINVNIIDEVTQKLVRYSPDCSIIVITNPVDAMTYLTLKVSGFERNKVVGLSGVLDSSRFSSFLAAELDISPNEVSSIVLGEHGKNMVVIPRLATVMGKKIEEIVPAITINQLIERTINGGAEVVGLLKTGSAFYAPSAAAAQMVEAIILDSKEILPCATYLNGEYGIYDTVIGVPVKLGKKGIEEIVELDLTSQEIKALKNSSVAVRKLIESINLTLDDK